MAVDKQKLKEAVIQYKVTYKANNEAIEKLEKNIAPLQEALKPKLEEYEWKKEKKIEEIKNEALANSTPENPVDEAAVNLKIQSMVVDAQLEAEIQEIKMKLDPMVAKLNQIKIENEEVQMEIEKGMKELSDNSYKPSTNASQLLEDLEGIVGESAEESKMKEEIEEQELSDELAALKAKMNKKNQ